MVKKLLPPSEATHLDRTSHFIYLPDCSVQILMMFLDARQAATARVQVLVCYAEALPMTAEV